MINVCLPVTGMSPFWNHKKRYPVMRQHQRHEQTNDGGASSHRVYGKTSYDRKSRHGRDDITSQYVQLDRLLSQSLNRHALTGTAELLDTDDKRQRQDCRVC